MTKRANFINIQMSHVIPVSNYEVGRVRTGYEAVVPYLTNEEYCAIAKDDGIILDVNEKLNTFKIKYKDGTIKTYDYSNKIGESQGKFVYHTLEITDKIKKGAKVKKGDFLHYNTSYFGYDDFTKSYVWKNGVYCNIALFEKDVTIEDSNLITPSLVKKLAFNSTHLRQIELSSDMVILDYKFLFDEVEYTTPLFNITYSDLEQLDIKDLDEDANELNEILTDLQTIQTKAKFDGVITDIQVYYSCDKSEMDPSIRKFVNKVESIQEAKKKFASGSFNEDEFIPPGKLEPGTRIKKKELKENTIVVYFYITHKDDMSIGDKIVIGNQLKSINAEVYPYNIYTEDGKTIDIAYGADSLYNRIVTSAIKTGIIETILEELENEITEDL